jgi:multiple sugar transport system substrate-binding protein
VNALRLQGITWNHSRAFPPLVAVSQRYEELHPHVHLSWDKRTLDEFGHTGLAELARSYDLLIIDHPMLGEAHRDKTLLDFLPHIDIELITELETDALGACLESYRYEGHLYALPIDVAAPAASYRPDLLDRFGRQLPTRWDELITLAHRKLTVMPGFPADLFLNFLGMCASRRGLIQSSDCFLDSSTAALCLEELSELASFMPPAIYGMNPIDIYEAMSSDDEFAYCPFAYTYSNYSRPGFAAHLLSFTNPVALRGGAVLRTVLGGTGIAVSASCIHPDRAIDFCRFVAGRGSQAHLYGVCGGQPASKAAWRDSLLNDISGNFFDRTMASIENALVRPRYAGYIGLQRSAGSVITAFLQHESSIKQTLIRLEGLYRKSLADTRIGRETA